MSERKIVKDEILGEEIYLFEERVLPTKNWFDKIAVGFFSVIAVVSSLALAVIISAAAFTRYVIRGDLYGYEEWVKLIAFWLYFMGGAYGAYNDTHVSADLIDAYLPQGRPRQMMIFIRQAITALMSIYFTYLGYTFFMFGMFGPVSKPILSVTWMGEWFDFKWINFATIKGIARTTIWQLPLWTSYLAIFLGLIFMSIYFSRRCIHTGIKLLKGGAKA